MAFRRRRRQFRMPGPKPNTHWICSENEGLTVAIATLVEEAVLVTADYASNSAASPTGVTLLAQYLTMTYFTAMPAAVGSYRAYTGLVLIDSDETAAGGGDFDPTLPQNLIDERWMWLDVKSFSVSTGVGGWQNPSVNIKVKSKARLRDNGVSLIVRNLASPATLTFAYMYRALVQGDVS